MTLHALLEDFGPPIGRSTTPVAEPEPALPEEERLAAFEKGYGEGYEDATRAADEERRRVGLALAGRLEDLSFTFHEARAAVLREVRDLVAAVADGVLPAMARGGFGSALVEAIEAELEERAACPVEVSVAPEAVDVVAPLMPEVKGFPVSAAGRPRPRRGPGGDRVPRRGAGGGHGGRGRARPRGAGGLAGGRAGARAEEAANG